MNAEEERKKLSRAAGKIVDFLQTGSHVNLRLDVYFSKGEVRRDAVLATNITVQEASNIVQRLGMLNAAFSDDLNLVARKEMEPEE